MTREDFEQAQGRLSENARRSTRGGVISHVASGIAACGICGTPMSYRNSYLLLAHLSHAVVKGDFLESRIRREVVSALMLPGVIIESMYQRASWVP